MTDNRLTPEEVLQSIQTAFSTGITEPRIEKHASGLKKTPYTYLWMTVDRSIFKNVVNHLFTFDTSLHFAVASGYDAGQTINLVYHFSIYHGTRAQELSLNMTVVLPKTDPVIDTITDLIPGALISEQEKQEMLGVKVKGIPKDSRVFISDDFPKDVYPWRRDETGPAKNWRNLHEVEK